MRRVMRVPVASLLSVAMLWVATGPAAASAEGGEAGSGTVTATATGGAAGDGAAGVQGGFGGAATGAGQTECTSTSLVLNDEGGFAPGGPTPGGWYSVTCTDVATGAQVTQTEWVPDQAGAPQAPANPYDVALSAERAITLPKPMVSTDPAGTAVVNLPTWLWIDASLWHPQSVTASVGTVSATTVATPVSVSWSMGNGATLTCAGPGVPYLSGYPSGPGGTEPPNGCAYSYPESSAGQPSADGLQNNGSFPVTASVTWQVTWTSAGIAGGGTLPSLVTSTSTRLRVEQIESIDTDGGSA